MSKYTTELRFICETLAGHDMSKGYGKVNEIIEQSYEKIFDFDFPIFDNAYRSVLCQKILKHYYTREIGFETVGLWKLKLETKMQEIMPYYNKLYESETYRFNPLYDVDYTKEHDGESNGSEDIDSDHTGTVTDAGTHGGTITDSGTHGGTIEDETVHTGTVTDAGTHTGTIGDSYSKDGTVGDDGTKNTWNVFSDTPQGALTNVENDTYLTDARKINETDSNDREYEESGTDTKTFNEGTGNTRTYNENIDNTRTFDETTGNTKTFNETNGNTRTYNEANESGKTFNNTLEYSEHVMGKMGGKTYASMIMEYRESLLNIDMMVIKDLNDLFMLVW